MKYNKGTLLKQKEIYILVHCCNFFILLVNE